MAYRNKTYVCFASEDIKSYNLMEAWKANTNIDFNFFDAHNITPLMQTSSKETIRRRLRERLANTKQAVLLLSDVTRKVAGDSERFLYYELEIALNLQLPIVVANLNGSRSIQTAQLPRVLDSDYYTVSTSFQPKIIQYALDNYVQLCSRVSGQPYGHHSQEGTPLLQVQRLRWPKSLVRER